jgi:hypothetical protein
MTWLTEDNMQDWLGFHDLKSLPAWWLEVDSRVLPVRQYAGVMNFGRTVPGPIRQPHDLTHFTQLRWPA